MGYGSWFVIVASNFNFQISVKIEWAINVPLKTLQKPAVKPKVMIETGFHSRAGHDVISKFVQFWYEAVAEMRVEAQMARAEALLAPAPQITATESFTGSNAPFADPFAWPVSASELAKADEYYK